jgi:hypothetical protein
VPPSFASEEQKRERDSSIKEDDVEDDEDDELGRTTSLTEDKPNVLRIRWKELVYKCWAGDHYSRDEVFGKLIGALHAQHRNALGRTYTHQNKASG